MSADQTGGTGDEEGGTGDEEGPSRRRHALAGGHPGGPHEDGPHEEQRPWGSFTVLDESPSHKVKRIEVAPGRRLSYQRHSRRAEHWFVVSGHACATLDGVAREVTSGTAIDIPVGCAHRVENVGDEPLVFVEVQHGEYFGEDDIVRLEDDFGRVDR